MTMTQDVSSMVATRSGDAQAPVTAAFPGEWESNIKAPTSRTIIPKCVLSLPSGDFLQEYSDIVFLESGVEGLVFDFGIEVGGIVTIDFEPLSTSTATLGLAFTEAKDYIGRSSDNSNGGGGQDGALLHVIDSSSPNSYTMPVAKMRGGFRYLTLFLDSSSDLTLKIRRISLEINFQPTWKNLRAYQGYFHCNDELINKIWYSGAYTLQTNCAPANSGRISTSDRTGWQNDETIGPGSSVLLDGAKRDRWVWIGDMGVAVPTAFVSTGDLDSTKNALLAIYNNQVADGSLPKAGPPYTVTDSDTYQLWTLIGTFNYFLYSGDEKFIWEIWPKYTKAINSSLNKINHAGIVSVTGVKDWGRFTYESERASASMLLYRALITGANITTWVPMLPEAGNFTKRWQTAAAKLRVAIMKELWDTKRGAFKDSPNNTILYPQDANSMSVAFGVLSMNSDEALQVSDYLESNWTPIGASCPELPQNISPFISSIEIQGHFQAGRPDRAIKLIRDAWGWYLRNPNGTESTFPEGYLADGTWGYRGKHGYRNDPSYVSHAHGWSTGPTATLTEYGVGLRVTKPQGSEWQLSPASFKDLAEAQAGFTTGRGKYSASYKVKSGEMVVEWDTPKGTKGFLQLPGQRGRWVEGGKGSTSMYCP